MRALLTILALLVAAPALADVVHLKDGRTLEGETEWTPAGKLRIKLKMGEMLIDEADVLRVEKVESPADQYQRRRDALDPDDLEAAVELARFCMKLEPIRKHAGRLLTDAVAAAKAREAANQGDAPAQKLARAEAFRIRGRAEATLGELDYHLVDGGWLSPAEYYPPRGFVKVGDKWLTQAEADKAKAARAKRSAARNARQAEAEARKHEQRVGRAEDAYGKAEDALDKAHARVEHYGAEAKRINDGTTFAEAELARRHAERVEAEGLERVAKSTYDAYFGKRCDETVCRCGWERRSSELQRIRDDARRLAADTRRLETQAESTLAGLRADQQEVRKLQRGARKKLAKAKADHRAAEKKLEKRERKAEDMDAEAHRAKGELQDAKEKLDD